MCNTIIVWVTDSRMLGQEIDTLLLLFQVFETVLEDIAR